MNITPLPIMLLPPIHIPSLVIPPQQKNLMRQQQLHGEEVGYYFEAGETAVDVVSEEEEVTGG